MKKRKRKKRAITNYSSVSGTTTFGLIISGIQPEVFLKSIPQYPFIKQNLSQINSKSYRFSPTDLAIRPVKNTKRAITNYNHFRFTISGIKPEILYNRCIDCSFACKQELLGKI